MSGSRTLKLSILADVDDLKKKLDSANNEVENSSNKLAKFGEMAKGAFIAAAIAAAAYAAKLSVDGVKAAIEDEQAQLRLASALKTATGATNAQIAATEGYITKTAIAVGVADDELRPALQRLSVATGDVQKSQDLLNLALDVSKGTGKPLGDVVEALGKAYEGNQKKLAALGIGLTATELKTMTFKDATQQLSDLYGGAAARNADTFQGRIDRLKVGFSEAKEAIGYQLLPIIEKLVGYIFQYGVPIFEKYKEAADKIKDAIERNQDAFRILGEIFKQVFPIIANIFGKIWDIGAAVSSAIIDIFGKIVRAIEPTVNFIIGSINKVITGLNYIKGGADIAYIPKIDITPTPSVSVPKPNIDLNLPSFNTGSSTSGGGGISGGAIAGAASSGASASAANPTGLLYQYSRALTPEEVRQMAIDAAASAATYNITVNGAIDSESSARQIVDIINQSAGRGGAVVSTPFML
jgi:hypothetical protein